MGFNIIGGLLSAGEGFLGPGGNPIAAAGTGLAGALSGGATGGNVIGGAGNSALGAMDAQDEAFQVAMYGEQIRHQETLQVQSQAFDEMMDEKSEQMRRFAEGVAVLAALVARGYFRGTKIPRPL